MRRLALLFLAFAVLLAVALDDVGLFNVALEEEDIVEIKEKGLKEATGATPVSPLDTLVSTWGKIKSE